MTWELVNLGNVCEVVRGGSPRPIIDYITKGEEGVNWLKIGDVNESDKYFRYTNEKIKPSGISKTREVVAGDLILSNSMSFGRAFITLINGYIHDGWLRLRPNEKVLDKDYLYYFLTSNIAQNQFKAIATGSVVNNLKSDTVKAAKVFLPPIKIQKKIADYLNAIDEKIELNKAINNNLEQQTNALYQTFFSPKSGTKGKIATLDEYCSIFTGKKNANASVNDGKYKFFTCAPEALQIDSYIFDGNAIIVSGNGAYTGRTRFYSGKFDLYQRTYACTLLDNVNPDFIFPLYWFVKLELSKKIIGGTRGSAIPYIVMNDLAKFEFVYNEEIFANYTPLFKSLTEAIQANEFESENLAQIRDSLLPKLMSGELDVSDIDL